MKPYVKAVVLSLIVSATSCKKDSESTDELIVKSEAMSNNTLLQEWTGPFDGVPAFDKMKVTDVKEALETGMALGLKDIEAIANNPEAPTFENTIEALERSGKELNRVFAYYGIFSSNMSSPEFREVQSELAPKLSEYSSKINQNTALFQRIKTVYKASQKNPLDSEKQRVLNLIYKRFEMDGAELDDAKKKRYADINKELSSLYTDFGNNVLHDEENYITYLEKDQLGGLSQGFIKSAAKIA
ncbi:MAG: M3 family peptidase, partial [Bizionia sp.]|nr:M3 family peptidase [Bizionia sp.]